MNAVNVERNGCSMVHICNECSHREDCKEFLKDRAGILCNNKLYQKERENQWSKEKMYV